MKIITILIVDDHPIMREALAMALNEEFDMEVIGEAADGNAALRFLEEHKPDVILMDLLMPGMDGLETVEKIIAADSQARILVVTSQESEEKVVAAFQAGALGYFPKTAPRSFLLEAIRKIADGVPYMPAGITLKLLNGLRELKHPQPQASQPEINQMPLTPRQEQILALLSEGWTDYEIGRGLHIEETTVRAHIARIIQRLGVANRTQAALMSNRLRKTG